MGGDDYSADGDGDTMSTDADTGITEWTDTDGYSGSITSAGATVESPDGSTTAMDAQGNEVHFDADGNYTESLAPTSAPHTSNSPKPHASDSDFRLPSDIREPDWSK